MRISVINMTRPHLADAEVLRAVRAINRQLREDFAPHWHAAGELRLDHPRSRGRKPQPSAMRGEAILYLVTASSRDEALGYHDRNNDGVPFGFVSVDLKLEKKDDDGGSGWTVTLSHEALELVADRHANLLCKGPHPDPAERGRLVYHWLEVCDAVQDESYEIDGVRVSNFVLPRYFTAEEERGARNDFLGTKLGAAGTGLLSFGVNPGGYVGFFDPVLGTDESYDAGDARSAERQRVKATTRGFRRKDRREANRRTDDDHCFEAFAVRLKNAVTPTDVDRLVAVAFPGAVAVKRVQDTGSGKGRKDKSGTKTIRKNARVACWEELDGHRLLLLPPEQDQLDAQEAWRRSHALKALAGVLWSEPLFELLVDETAPPHLRASGGETKHLPGTERALWAFQAARFDGAWAADTKKLRGQGIRVGHPDTGIHPHPEVPNSGAPKGVNYVEQNKPPRDPLVRGPLQFPGHGVSTISVLVSPDGKQLAQASATGVYGVAPGAEYRSYRVSTSVIHFSMLNVTKAIHQAITDGCDVLSMSLGGPVPWWFLHEAIDRAIASGLIVCAAAGNYVGFVCYPAAFADVIGVAGTNIDGRAWWGSSRGDRVDVSAPAESVWIADFELTSGAATAITKRGSGTSFAVVHVAGAAALWLAHHGKAAVAAAAAAAGVTVQALFASIVRATARNKARLPAGFGTGILDAEAVLKAPLSLGGVQKKAEAKKAKARKSARIPREAKPRPALPPRPTTDWLRGELAALLEVENDARLTTVLEGLKPTGVSVEGWLDAAGEELLFHAGTDTILRTALRVAHRRRHATALQTAHGRMRAIESSAR